MRKIFSEATGFAGGSSLVITIPLRAQIIPMGSWFSAVAVIIVLGILYTSIQVPPTIKLVQVFNILHRVGTLFSIRFTTIIGE